MSEVGMSEVEQEARKLRNIAGYIFALDQAIMCHEFGRVEEEQDWLETSRQMAKLLDISLDVQERIFILEKESLQKNMYQL